MWDWAVWGALVVAICSGIAALVVLGRRVLEAVRTVKSVRSHAVTSLSALTTKAEVAAEKAARAGDTRELRESVARLRAAIAQLSVLRAAIDEVERELYWVRALL